MVTKENLVLLQFNKLSLELKTVESELEYCRALVDSARSEFNKRFHNEMKNRDIVLANNIKKSEEPKKENREQRRKKKKASPETKKLYKQIANQTHPDKVSSLDASARAVREKQFQEAAAALEQDKISVLRDLALQLDIETPPPSQSDIDAMLEAVSEKQKELSDIKGTVAYVYANCKTPVERSAVMESYVTFVARHHDNET